MRAFRWPVLWISIWILMIAAVAVGSLMPAQDLPPLFPNADKLEHLLGYAVLSAWGALLYARARSLARVAIGLVAYGIAIEIAQALFTTGRQAEFMDAVADAVGVAIGMVVVRGRFAELLVRVEARLG